MKLSDYYKELAEEKHKEAAYYDYLSRATRRAEVFQDWWLGLPETKRNEILKRVAELGIADEPVVREV